jgi:hypothetical protein
MNPVISRLERKTLFPYKKILGRLVGSGAAVFRIRVSGILEWRSLRQIAALSMRVLHNCSAFRQAVR